MLSPLGRSAWKAKWARPSRGWPAAGRRAGVVAGIGVAGLVSHVGVLFCVGLPELGDGKSFIDTLCRSQVILF